MCILKTKCVQTRFKHTHRMDKYPHVVQDRGTDLFMKQANILFLIRNS